MEIWSPTWIGNEVLTCFDYLETRRSRWSHMSSLAMHWFSGTSSHMRKRHTRDLYNRLQHIVEEYHRDMEVALTKANVLE
ncbi:hypothetical protein CR513_21707, partial [Mucuna pruriens]